MNKRWVGSQYEQIAREHLQKKGVKILRQNYRCRFGEIDIIGEDVGCLVFLEVKYRKSQSYGGAISAVSQAKQRTICKVAAYYLLENQILDNVPCRFDVIAISGDDVEWIQQAFEYKN